MKLDEVIPEAGRPIAYYPRLRQIAGSTNAAILLCQLIYWTGKQRDPHGWIQKRAYLSEDDPEGSDNPENQSLEFETGLTYKEQFEARRQLRVRGLLRDRYSRSDHRLYFRLNLEAVRAAGLRATEGHPPQRRMASSLKEDGIDPTEDGILPKGGSLIGTNRDYTESTTEKGVTNFDKTDLPSSWNLAHALPVSDEQLEREREGDRATAAFESALGVENWPWASTRAWEKLVALLTKAWKEDAQIFNQYAEWAEGEGRFKAMTAKQIRLNPQQFIDTGWPLFVSSRRRKQEPIVQEESDLERRIREGIGAK